MRNFIRSRIFNIEDVLSKRQLLLFIAVFLFLEFCTMLVMDFLPPLSLFLNAFIDCTILTILLAPAVYLFNRREEKYLMEQKRTRAALKESEVHFFTLANTGQALIWTTGPDQQCNYVNQPWLSFTGRTIENQLGEGWMEGIHPDDVPQFLSVYRDS